MTLALLALLLVADPAPARTSPPGAVAPAPPPARQPGAPKRGTAETATPPADSAIGGMAPAPGNPRVLVSGVPQVPQHCRIASGEEA